MAGWLLLLPSTFPWVCYRFESVFRKDAWPLRCMVSAPPYHLVINLEIVMVCKDTQTSSFMLYYIQRWQLSLLKGTSSHRRRNIVWLGRAPLGSSSECHPIVNLGVAQRIFVQVEVSPCTGPWCRVLWILLSSNCRWCRHHELHLGSLPYWVFMLKLTVVC